MKLLLKPLQISLGLLFATATIQAQTINIEFRNTHLEGNGTVYNFEVWAGAGQGYDVADPETSNWQGMNVRGDVQVPMGVTITNTDFVANTQYCSDGGISTIVQGMSPAGMRPYSLNLLRLVGDELTPSGVKLGDATLVFSGPVPAGNITTVRPFTGLASGSFWANENPDVPRAIAGPQQQALPVKLSTFEASKEGKAVNLTWSTTEEINSDHFDVERSKNGKQWSVIKTVKASGDSKAVQMYQAVDNSPLAGNNLYRLHMIDKDGSNTYSSVRNVKFEGEVLSMYPNPVSNTLTIDAADFAQISKVRILNANGVEVYQSGAKPQSKVDVSKLSAGIYIVSLKSQSGEEKSYKIVVSRQ